VRLPTPAELDGISDDIRRGGIKTDAMRILHHGSSLVIGDGQLVVRITEEDESQAEEIIGRALALGASRAPVLQPAHPRPVVTRLGTATIWPQGKPAPDPVRNLGKVLAALHATTDVTVPARPETRHDLRRRLRELSGIGVDENVLLRLMRITARLPEETSWREDVRTIIHGDAHTGNIIWHDGQVVLLDTSTVGMGEHVADMVPAWCTARRAKRGRELWTAFRTGYGERADDLLEWRHLEEAVLEREILTTIFLAEQWQTRPWVRDELETRLNSWDDPETGPRWNTGD
jgi:aminoglycoside phosphotransferase (APT) family kinase protein